MNEAAKYMQWPASTVCGALQALRKAHAFSNPTKDNAIMLDMSNALDIKGTLSSRQLDFVRLKLVKYEKILNGLVIVDVPVEDDKAQVAQFTMHNPSTLRIYPSKSPFFYRIKSLSGLERHPDGFYLLPFSRRNVYILLNNGFIMGKRVQEFMDSYVTRLPSVDFSGIKRELKGYQKKGVKLCLARQGRVLLADEQGLGKTGEAISWAYIADISKICVVCPASLKANWQREVRLWTGDEDCCIVSGKSITAEIKQELKKCRWIIINYDILAEWQGTLSEVGIVAFIFDEAQALKNQATKRARAASRLARKAKNVLMLSGTPIENRPLEFYSLISMIDPHLFPSKTKYMERYCDLKYNAYGFLDASGASNTLELNKILAETIMVRRKKADVLTELPDKQRALVPLRLADSALEEYRNIRDNFTAWLKNNNLGVSDGTLRRKLRAQAMIKIIALKDAASRAKLPLVIDWITSYLENESKLVVFAEHHAIIDALKEWAGDKAVVIDGRVASDKRQAICDEFQNNPKIRLFIGNIKAAGTGLTLTAAKDTLTIEFAWTSAAHDQCEDRVHRIGQKNCVTAYYLFAEDTIEEKIVALLDKKRDIMAQVIDGEATAIDSLFNSLITEFRREE